MPYAETIIRRQCIKNVGDVGRMQLVDFTLQLGKILPVHEVVDDIVACTNLATSNVFHQTMAIQHGDHARQTALQWRG